MLLSACGCTHHNGLLVLLCVAVRLYLSIALQQRCIYIHQYRDDQPHLVVLDPLRHFL